MFEKLETPRDLFLYRLAMARKMEQEVEKMLTELEEKAISGQLKRLLHEHLEETERHINRVEDAFVALTEDLDSKSSPPTKGLSSETSSVLRKAEEPVMDAVILAGAAETEHHEIAVYEDLVVHAEALGLDARVAGLLRENLEEEERMLARVKEATHEVARVEAAA